MRARYAVASSLHLFVVFIFFLVSSFFFALPFLPEARIRFVDLVLHSDEICAQIGAGTLGIGLILFAGFFGLNRGKEMAIRMGKYPISVDLRLLEDLLGRRLQKQGVQLSGVEIVQGKKLEIAVGMESIEETKREAILADVERALQTILSERFGYFKPFHLIVKI